MAGDAQIPRVACGAARGDADLSRRRPRHSREPAVTAKSKIRRVMRARASEASDVGASQTRCVGQAHVTRRACAARNIHVWILQTVTVETLSDDGIMHSHPGRSDLNVARGAILCQRTVAGILCRCGTVVHLVSEPPVPRARTRPWLPRHLRLYHTVVTRLATPGLGENRLPDFNYSCVTCRAKRKDIGMLLMRKALCRCAAAAWSGQQRSGREQADGQRRAEAPYQLHRGVGRAGGSGVRSAPDPNARLIPARTRNWSSDEALASGLSRSSLTRAASPQTRCCSLRCH
jgi:hypothetical protein